MQIVPVLSLQNNPSCQRAHFALEVFMQKLSQMLQSRFGEKVYRLSLSSGCTCPNRDGTLGWDGCTFCSRGGSGEFAAPPLDLDTQIALARERIRKKTDARRFIAYFQSYTNTYGDPARLTALYRDALSREEIVALSLGTRPDCLGSDMLRMLRELASIKPVWVELGLQTCHEETARRIRRGYALPVFEQACRDLSSAGAEVIVHVIFGLPGETPEQMLQTLRYLAGVRPSIQGIKIQMLCVLEGTAMGEAYLRDPFPLLSLTEYADLVARGVALLPPDMVLHRMTGDPPRDQLIAPRWVLDKRRVLNTLEARFRQSGLRFS